MKRNVLTTASLSAAVIAATIGIDIQLAAAQNNSLYVAEQQKAFASAAENSPAPQSGANSSRTRNSSSGNSQVSAAPSGASPAPLSLADASWTYQSPAEAKIAQINDIVRVQVSIKSTMASLGKIDRKKQGYGGLKLASWIKFYDWNLGEDKQNYGTPEVRGNIDNKIQAQGDLQTNDKLTFTISCRIVDKRPNGNCILEGNWSVRDNEENWEYSLSGEIRPADIKPDNSVISDTIADLKVMKREAGHVRDSYRRGWALEWLDKWQPF
jgi:flagellar L-ring protein FlgH